MTEHEGSAVGPGSVATMANDAPDRGARRDAGAHQGEQPVFPAPGIQRPFCDLPNRIQRTARQDYPVLLSTDQQAFPTSRARIGRCMYLEHFRLSTQPFKAIARGDQVYLGPRQSRALANLQIALATPDGIAAVTGPVGVGKTTLVNRVLEEVAPERTVARVGRTSMTVDQLLEHLLGEFGVSAAGMGRVERLRALRQFFKHCGSDRVRALVLVEDASILGAPLLAELESVTAADPDGSPGANIILMGPDGMHELLDAPHMEHVRQRTRLRQRLEALEVGEVAGYVKHQLACAGGDFATIVHPLVPKILWHCSGGLPRMVNNLCETALTVAANNNIPSLLPQLVQRIAASIYGMNHGNGAISRPAAPPPDKAPAENTSARKTAAPRAAKRAGAGRVAPAASEPAGTAPGPDRHSGQAVGTASNRPAVTGSGEAPPAAQGTLKAASEGSGNGEGAAETPVSQVCESAPAPEGPSLTRQAHMATLAALNDLAARLGTASAAGKTGAPEVAAEAAEPTHTGMQTTIHDPAPVEQPEAAAISQAPPATLGLDFSCLVPDPGEGRSPALVGGAVAEEMPSMVEPPGTAPVDPDIQRLAARVAQVANLEDLDELLVETLFADVELEGASAENKALENDRATAHAEDAAIATAENDRREGDNDQCSEARNAVG